MLVTQASSSAIVIDSNLAVWEVVPVLAQADVSSHFVAWGQAATRLCAPTLWIAESVSAVRSAVYTRLISPQEGELAIDDLFALEVEILPMDIRLSHSALQWAERLGQRRAYDATYLALAEDLGTDFWTAERRLVNSAQQAGLPWVRWIGEAVEDA
jgi:predicted nucleic acid-binding protein